MTYIKPAMLLALAALAGCATAGNPRWRAAPVRVQGIVATDPAVVPVLAHLLGRSPTAAAAVARALAGGSTIHVHSFESGPLGRAGGGFAYGYSLPVVDGGGVVREVHVALDVRRIGLFAGALGMTAGATRAEAAVVLAHELYGHAVPWLEAGGWQGVCGDEDWSRPGCAVERENRVRHELGFPAREDYTLLGLQFSRNRDEQIVRMREAYHRVLNDTTGRAPAAPGTAPAARPRGR